MIYERMNMHTFMRKFFAPQIYASQGWFSTRAAHDDEDLDVSASLSTLLPPSIEDATLACEKARAEILDLIPRPFGVGFPTTVLFICLQLRDVKLNFFSLPEWRLGRGTCFIDNYLKLLSVKPSFFFLRMALWVI